MGVSYHVYVGPFIEVHNPPQDSFKEFHGCEKCNRETSDKFCSRCGGKVKLLKEPTKAPKDFDCYSELDDNLSEAFTEYPVKKNYNYYIPNKGKIGSHFCAYDSNLVEQHAEGIMEETKKVATTFAKDIARLKEVFGDDKVVLKWGVIAYAS